MASHHGPHAQSGFTQSALRPEKTFSDRAKGISVVECSVQAQSFGFGLRVWDLGFLGLAVAQELNQRYLKGGRMATIMEHQNERWVISQRSKWPLLWLNVPGYECAVKHAWSVH